MTYRGKIFGFQKSPYVHLILIACVAVLAVTPLSADDVKLEAFPRGKWLDVTWQAYWTFGDDTIRLLDVHDAEIYDFAGIVQNMKVTNLPKGGVRLTFDCEQAHRSYLFEKSSATSPMQMVIRQKGSSIAYKMAMPPVSDTQLTDYKAAVIAEKPAEVAKIVASIQDIPSSAKAAQRAEQTKAQTASMLEVAATADFQKLESLSIEAEKQGILDAMIQTLEAEAAKDGAPPAVFISLSVLYGRKNLKTQSYAALELAEKAPVPPNVNLNVSLLYGRKKLLAGAPDANTFMVGDIEILSVPDGVPVFLDGVEKGKGNMTLSKVPAGMHTIRCDHPDYQLFNTDFSLGVGQSQQVKVDMALKECTLVFAPYVSDGKVSIDGVVSAYNSLLFTVTPGVHTIGVVPLNYKPVTVTAEIGKTVFVEWMQELAEVPWDINTYPEGATVSIDGKTIGTAPLKDVPVLAKELEVVCEWPGKTPVVFRQNFLLKSTETKGAVTLKQPFIIPTMTIKIDGKNDDWADVEGPEMRPVSPASDLKSNLAGNYLSKALICQDEQYIYWYMEFSDGSPLHSTGFSYSAFFTTTTPEDGKNLALKLGNKKASGSRTWKPNIPSNFATDGKTDADLWNDLGSSSNFKVGNGFIEARFPRASVLKAVGENNPVLLDFQTFIESSGSGCDLDFGEVYFKRL